MTVRAVRLRDIEDRASFLPHAVFRRPVAHVAEQAEAEIESGCDDFDEFDQAAALVLDERLPFVVMHYKGHPDDTSTLYLPPHVRPINEITRVLTAILDDLRLRTSDLVWQRADDPEL